MTRQIYLTVIVLTVSFLIFEFSQIDLLVQDQFFDFSNTSWLIDRHNPLIKFLFYDGIKVCYILFVMTLLVTLIGFGRRRKIAPHTRALIIVLASTIVIPVTVNMLKASTNVACPRELTRSGGTYPYVSVMQAYPGSFIQQKSARCFPAGHASGGFALLSLCLLFNTPRARALAIGAGLGIGWTLGLYKMAIGDHFLGHTVITMLLAWLIILMLNRVIGGTSGTVRINGQDH
jgi:membrane-associated PAP2 superfamily phosphatase